MLVTLPRELLLILLTLLDPASRCLFSMTCRTLNTLYKPSRDLRRTMTTAMIAQCGYHKLLTKVATGHPLEWVYAIHGGHLNCAQYLHGRYQYRLTGGCIETAAHAGHTHILGWFHSHLRAFHMPNINTSIEKMVESIKYSSPDVQAKVHQWLYSIGYRPKN